MADSEPQGCLAAILSLFGIRLSRAGDAPLPYRQRDDFLSPAELSFFQVLSAAVGESFTVCPKVNLADIFFVTRPHENQSYRNRIDRKHVDFLLCDPATMRPVLGIELDDASHGRRDRQDRDQFVGQVFLAAGLPLLRIPAAAAYSPKQLLERVQEKVAERVIPEGAPQPKHGSPMCPKCNTPMVRRTAKRGEQKGGEFWGCSNYPKCRETSPA